MSIFNLCKFYKIIKKNKYVYKYRIYFIIVNYNTLNFTLIFYFIKYIPSTNIHY